MNNRTTAAGVCVIAAGGRRRVDQQSIEIIEITNRLRRKKSSIICGQHGCFRQRPAACCNPGPGVPLQVVSAPTPRSPTSATSSEETRR
jgi:hypothetical protein